MERTEINAASSPVSTASFVPVEMLTRRPARALLPQQESRNREPVEVPVREDAERELDRLNKILEGVGSRLKFDLYGEGAAKQFFVKVVDRESNTVLKMMPSEEVLNLRSRIRDAVGLLLDERH